MHLNLEACPESYWRWE